MALPERLVTIRTYDSPELAAGDHQALLDEGFDAYLSASHFRPGGTSELRVPESQVDAARELLPPALPTLHDLTRPRADCHTCGGAVVRVSPAIARYLFYAGLVLAGSSFLRGDVRAAVVLVITAAVLATFVRQASGRLVCERCGTEWRRRSLDDSEEQS
jgi:hypothetical protein